MYLAGIQPNQTLPNFFNPLVHHIETHVQDRQAPLPGRANLADDRPGRGRGRLAAQRPETDRYAPTCDKCATYPLANRPFGGADADGLIPTEARAGPSPDASPDRPRKRMAIITTVWRYLSHAQHMGDRFLVGYPWEGKWHRPAIDVVALYVDQKPKDDQSAERARDFGFKVYPTIAEALRCGGEKLAVDAVLIIGEHGDYPQNEKGQILYPRYEFFREATRVFEQDGRAVPVFNDKHLSFSFAKAREMVETSKRLKFPFLAGSSLPVTWRLPPIELPRGCVIDEALMVGVGASDPMDFHALEAMQCMVERRRGGETGVKHVQLIDGRCGLAGRPRRALVPRAARSLRFRDRIRSRD